MNLKQRASAAMAKLIKRVEKDFEAMPDYKLRGWRMEPDDDGIADGVTYSMDDLDQRPQFVKDDDLNW